MELLKAHAKIEGKVLIELSEEEARALLNITVYGVDPFLKWFYKNLGTSYLRSHENGLRSLFKSIGTVKQHLDKIDKARKIFNQDTTT